VEGDAKNFFEKKFSALSKNFKKGMGINPGLSNCTKKETVAF